MSYIIRAQHDGENYYHVSEPGKDELTNLSEHASKDESAAKSYAREDNARATAERLNSNAAGYSWYVLAGAPEPFPDLPAFERR